PHTRDEEEGRGRGHQARQLDKGGDEQSVAGRLEADILQKERAVVDHGVDTGELDEESEPDDEDAGAFVSPAEQLTVRSPLGGAQILLDELRGLLRIVVRLHPGQHGECLVATSPQDRKSTRLNSSHVSSSYAVICLKK